ncbi:MAG: hypothetical protein JW791_01150 [Nanoarchaeota archaeon]|nr:hypothetical protein [Nanoarchaeota archaeon]
MMRNGKVIVLTAMLMAFSLAFAQTNAQVSFIITVDNLGPEYSNYSSNTSTINALGQSVYFSSYWTDDIVGLDYYYFEWNGVNTTAKSFVDNWSNETRTVSDANLEGQSISYAFHAKDLNHNWNSTYEDTISVVSAAPEYYTWESNSSNPAQGDIVLFSSYWTDNFNVYNATMQTNHSGEWLDNQTIYLNSLIGWANYTWNTTGYAGESVWWRINGFDNATNMNTTSEYSINVV